MALFEFQKIGQNTPFGTFSKKMNFANYDLYRKFNSKNNLIIMVFEYFNIYLYFKSYKHFFRKNSNLYHRYN